MSDTTIQPNDPYAGLNDNDIYCRIENGEIIEYPVFGIHIRNRLGPISQYTKVVFNSKPAVPQYHTYVEHLTIFDNKPMVNYTVRPLTFNELINTVSTRSGINFEQEPLDIDKLDAEFIKRAITLASDYAEELLLKFVQTRSYSTIESAVGYKESKIPAYATEAARVIELRDLIFPALEAYAAKVYAKEVPFPMNLETVKAQFPELTWTNER